MHESLMTEEESMYATDIGGMYVLKYLKVLDAVKAKSDMNNNSKNVKCLSVDEIKKMLREAKIV